MSDLAPIRVNARVLPSGVTDSGKRAVVSSGVHRSGVPLPSAILEKMAPLAAYARYAILRPSGNHTGYSSLSPNVNLFRPRVAKV